MVWHWHASCQWTDRLVILLVVCACKCVAFKLTAARNALSVMALTSLRPGCRCGVDTPDAAAKLAEHVSNLSSQQHGSVNFRGIQAYHGGLQHVRDPQQRAAAVQKVGAVLQMPPAAVGDAAPVCGLGLGLFGTCSVEMVFGLLCLSYDQCHACVCITLSAVLS